MSAWAKKLMLAHSNLVAALPRCVLCGEILRYHNYEYVH